MPSAKNRSSDKRYACEIAGCSRTFSRHEHLQRHSLNHDNKGITCDICRAHFKRPDLLNRHLARHQEKAAQGAELMTRKRMWEGDDGQIVAKRPSVDSKASDRSTPPSMTPSSMLTQSITVPVTPPHSSATGEDDPCISFHDQHTAPYQHSNTSTGFSPHNMASTLEFQSLLSGGDIWDQPVLSDTYDVRDAQATAPFEETFNPDTASSFNMPYTTGDNYNWLFGDIGQLPSVIDTSTPPSAQSMLDPSLHCNLHALADASTWLMQTDNRHQMPVHQQVYFPSPSTISCHTSESRHLPSEAASSPRPLPAAMHLEYISAEMDETGDLPVINNTAYTNLLTELSKAQPRLPDGTPVQLDSPLLSVQSLQTFLDTFFRCFNNTYPLIHRATFKPAAANPLLLLSMILLGATYCDKDSHQLAVCIHDVMRPLIFVQPDFGPEKPQLWLLQTVLLVEVFGKSRAGQKQHGMSHLFHGMLINLIRRSDCQSIVPDLPVEVGVSPHRQWASWAEQEQKKRLAQLCFIWDVQHAVLFGQSLCMSAFELRSPLPCDKALWDASTAADWFDVLSMKPRDGTAMLLTELKAFFSPSPRRTDLNGLSRVVLLHGLMSISWDMTRRDQTSLGLMGDNLLQGGWRMHLKNAYDAWRADFDLYETAVRAALASPVFAPAMDRFFTSYRALFHAAHITLSSEVIDLQIYAGARNILGRGVSRTDYAHSKNVIKRWLTEQKIHAAHSSWHAACLLSLLVDGPTPDTFHFPWVVYLATLTVWTFHHGNSWRAAPQAPEDGDDMIWDTHEDMATLVGQMVRTGPQGLLPEVYAPTMLNPTVGLTAVVIKHLTKVRWAIVRDGMLVLRRLVPWRLVNEEPN